MTHETPQCPPNGQGITALLALGLLDNLEEQGKIGSLLEMEHNSAEYLHILVESMRCALPSAALDPTGSYSPPLPGSRSRVCSANGPIPSPTYARRVTDSQYYVTDPEFSKIPVEQLLSKVRDVANVALGLILTECL